MTKNKEKKIRKKFLADVKSMEKIEGLGKSRKVGDQLKALELFEEKYSKLPLRRASEFIEKKRKSKNKKVSEKAEEVYAKTIKERREKISESLKIFTQSYAKSIQESLAHLNKVSETFLISKQIAEQINKSIETPIKLMGSKVLAQYAAQSRSINELIEKQILPLTQPSPILTTSFYLQPLIRDKKSGATLSQLLGKEPEEIHEELEEAIESDKDIIFNYDAYRFLYDLERLLRGLIKKRIIEPYSDMLPNKIHKTLLDKWEERKKEEEQNKLVDNGYDLIEYSDFTDLKTIFEKGKNLDLFSDVANKEELKALISKLHELDPIRKKIAHSRALSKREFDKLRMYAEDINRIFKKK